MSRNRSGLANGSKIAIAAAALIGIFCWREVEFRFKTASMDEIRAALPAELLKQEPLDKAAQHRYVELVEMIPRLDAWEIDAICRTTLPAASRHQAATAFSTKNPNIEAKISGLLARGPIQWTAVHLPRKAVGLALDPIMGFSMVVNASALLFAENREFDRCTRLLLLSEQLGRRLLQAGGDTYQYSTAGQICLKTAQAIDDCLDLKGFPISNCKPLLIGVAPAPSTDEALAASIRVHFQQGALLWLPDPTKSWQTKIEASSMSATPMSFVETGLGTYNAMQTAKIMASILSTKLANARKPWSGFDRTAGHIIDIESVDLPKRTEFAQKNIQLRTLLHWKYQISMDVTNNSVGRELIASESYANEEFVLRSCEWRAAQNATRVLLASRIYRVSHGGGLPATLEGFLPILGAWPKDPYNGKPMIYNAKSEKVYSVGPNLTDDGGNFTPRSPGSLDVGVGLRQQP